MSSPHPRIEPQPVCTDRLTVSRSRINNLIDRAAAGNEGPETKEAYAAGVAEALEYILDGDNLTDRLAGVLGFQR